MKKKKCPYCGRRVPYSVAFSRRRKAEYVCKNCGRESRVVINRSVILAFIICAIISIAIFVLWVYLKLTYNPLGIVAIAVPLIIFTIISPRFVRFEPLRKYKKTMEAKKAGIAYSDNLAVSEIIDDVSEQHSVDEAPLKKLHSEGSRVNRHYITPPADESAEVPEVFEEAEDDVKEYRPDGNKYSANRRF